MGAQCGPVWCWVWVRLRVFWHAGCEDKQTWPCLCAQARPANATCCCCASASRRRTGARLRLIPETLTPVCAGAACKSDLLLLCERFQAAYGRAAGGGARAPICLNAAAVELGVPRRRLYDIMNVLEAVEVCAHSHALSACVPCSSWRARARHVRSASPAAFAENPDLCGVCPLQRLRTSQTCAVWVPAVDAVNELSWADSGLCMLSLLHSVDGDGESCSPCDLLVTERAARLTPHSGALQIVARTGKLTYEWRGTAHLPALLARLLAAEPAVEHRPRRHGWAGRAAAPGFAGASSPAGSEPVAGGAEGAGHPCSAGSNIAAPLATAAGVSMPDVNGAAGSAGRGNGCRLVQHSLWRLSILFVRLLLTSQVHHWIAERILYWLTPCHLRLSTKLQLSNCLSEPGHCSTVRVFPHVHAKPVQSHACVMCPHVVPGPCTQKRPVTLG